jgi:hypothetical protein
MTFSRRRPNYDRILRGNIKINKLLPPEAQFDEKTAKSMVVWRLYALAAEFEEKTGKLLIFLQPETEFVKNILK